MRTIVLAVALAAVVGTAGAQTETAAPRVELRPFIGAYVPTGALRDVMKDAPTLGAQAALQMRPGLHLVGTFGWVPATNHYAVENDRVDIYQYNVGTEIARVRDMGSGWLFKPFLGAGVGGRTYNYAAPELSTRSCFAGYGALGSEFQIAGTALRVEARDYVSCFKSPQQDGGSATRNDLSFTAGIAFHW